MSNPYVPPGRVEFDVAGGMCRLQFDPGHSTGREDNLNPGVGFTFIGDTPSRQHSGKYYNGMGVIRRSDAAKLRDMLDEFLTRNPPATVSASERGS